MKYVISEGTICGEQRFNAVGKARGDAYSILASKGFEILNIPTKSGIETKKIKKIKQYIQYLKNSSLWKKELNKLRDNDYVLIQYPLMNNCFNLSHIVKKFSKKINFILLIHDLNSIRYKDSKNGSFLNRLRVNSEDKNICNWVKYIISHNESMTQEMINNGIDESKIYNLQLFDYLNSKNAKANVKFDEGTIIAGNLSIKKATYLSALKTLNTKFNLYGVNFDDNCLSDNINYKGAFSPEELVNNLTGSFGLVWDGNSLDKCDGMWGNYLKYNNPHKASLYLSAGLPIIVWKESALAKFVEENELGITVNSLHEIENIKENMSKSYYKKIVSNVSKVSDKLKSGGFLSSVIDLIFNEK